MATLRNVVSCLAVTAMLMTMANATSYTVGDDNGWTVGPDYTAWVSGNPLRSATNLVSNDAEFYLNDKAMSFFNYFESHDVLEVLESAYDTCDASSPIKTHNGGVTTISLTAAGKSYYICGTPGHCDQGQKLAVETVETSSSLSPPKAVSPPPPEVASPPPPKSASPPSAYKISYAFSFALTLMILAAF